MKTLFLLWQHVSLHLYDPACSTTVYSPWQKWGHKAVAERWGNAVELMISPYGELHIAQELQATNWNNKWRITRKTCALPVD